MSSELPSRIAEEELRRHPRQRRCPPTSGPRPRAAARRRRRRPARRSAAWSARTSARMSTTPVSIPAGRSGRASTRQRFALPSAGRAPPASAHPLVGEVVDACAGRACRSRRRAPRSWSATGTTTVATPVMCSSSWLMPVESGRRTHRRARYSATGDDRRRGRAPVRRHLAALPGPRARGVRARPRRGAPLDPPRRPARLGQDAARLRDPPPPGPARARARAQLGDPAAVGRGGRGLRRAARVRRRPAGRAGHLPHLPGARAARGPGLGAARRPPRPAGRRSARRRPGSRRPPSPPRPRRGRAPPPAAARGRSPGSWRA